MVATNKSLLALYHSSYEKGFINFFILYFP